jgi:cell division initiation protein
MIEPADIEGIRFATTRLKEGYDQNEVDAFLDRVAEDYRLVLDKLRNVELERDTLKRAPADEPTQVIQQPPSVMVERVLAVAEQTAQQFVAEAKEQADGIIREAGGRGARVIEEATEAAERIKSEGYAEKYRKVEQLDQRFKQVSAAVEELERKGKLARDAMTNAINYYDRGVGNADTI